MHEEAQSPRFRVERMGETGGHCDCCGNASRRVWGTVSDGEEMLVAYWMNWTVGHLSDIGANLDLIWGRWGEGTSANDRVLVSMVHREQPDGTPALMVIDAGDRPEAKGELAETALDRDEVIGTPFAADAFALVDAIYEQDGRFF